MPESQNGGARRHLQTLFQVGTVGGLTDGQLLERFTTERDEAAFAALVERHGPMVLGVCMRVLRDPHDAEDAFQATFLVLVHRAGSVRKGDSVASWLHGVAYRVAACARSSRARRRRREREVTRMAQPCEGDDERADWEPVLTEEVNRLPERYRAAVVLCYLEGRTCEEAARQLGWPPGTVKSRLARARERLQARLLRRGLAPSAIALGALHSTESATASVPPALASATVQTAMGSTSGAVSIGAAPAIVALARSVLRGLLLVRLTAVATFLIALGIVAAGAVVMARQGPGERPETVPGRASRDDRHSASVQDKPAEKSERKGEDKPDGDRTAAVPTEFFSIPDRAGSFAYVIDRSGSMATRDSLDVVKQELRASLEKLTPDVRFSVIFYNLATSVFTDADGHPGMMSATASNKARVRAQLDRVFPDGGTDHMLALRAALALRPEVIFFLTDADLMTNSDVAEILARAGSTRIQAVEFGRGADLGGSGPLRRLAATTGGTYRYLDVTQFPRP